MGDRATIAFLRHDGTEAARVYIHNGGSRAAEIIGEFFQNETTLAQKHARDLRWNDPTMLAARFVAWRSQPDGLGVRVANADMKERQHVEVISSEDRTRRPEVLRFTTPPATTFLLWSNKHQMWWRSAACGYTDDIAEAGRYSEADAVERVARSAYHGDVSKVTCMVAAPENWTKAGGG